MKKILRRIFRKIQSFFSPRTVILLYHRIAEVRDDPHSLVVSPANFRAHLEYFLDHGWKFISLSECLQGKKIASKTAVLTFDDGYVDNLTTALPILESLHIPATFFIVAGKIGDQSPFYWDEKTRTEDRGRSMTREELVRLASSPLVEIGAHTMTHPRLSELSREEQEKEISQSKKILEEIVGKEVTGFAYPFGGKGKDFDEKTMQIVRNSGFKYACSTTKAAFTRNSDIFALPRVNIRNQSAEMVFEKCLLL